MKIGGEEICIKGANSEQTAADCGLLEWGEDGGGGISTRLTEAYGERGRGGGGKSVEADGAVFDAGDD